MHEAWNEIKSSAGSRIRPANVGTGNLRGLTRPAQDFNIHTTLRLPAGSVSLEIAFSQTKETVDVCVGDPVLRNDAEE